MIRTLGDVIQNEKALIARLNQSNEASGKSCVVYDHAYMENVTVIPDDVALRLVETLYINNTHFVPGRLPGNAMAIGDIVSKDGAEYLTVSWGVMNMNTVMLHASRAYEAECAAEAALSEKARATKTAVKKSEKLNGALRKLRSQHHHKGMPHVAEGLLLLSSPAASGGASWHSMICDDDVIHGVPNSTTLFMIGCQAGRTRVTHMGAGHVTGKTFVICLPKQPLIAIQARVDQDPVLIDLWAKLQQVDEEYENVIKWSEATLPYQQSIVRKVAPEIVRGRVLGFHVDLTGSSHGASLSPVVAQSHLAAHGKLPDRIRPKQFAFNDLLMETHEGYGRARSLFDRTGEAA